MSRHPAALDVATVRSAFEGPRPEDWTGRSGRGWQAATALVLAPGPSALELTLIERAERPGDRWSGHMALPGGKRDAEDLDLATTARRETWEEVGLALPAPIGRLDDHGGRTRRGTVASFVFVLEERPPLVPAEAEVAAAWWVPLPQLFDPAAATRYRWGGVPFPGIAHQGRVIWGLTHRILGSFAATLDLQPVG